MVLKFAKLLPFVVCVLVGCSVDGAGVAEIYEVSVVFYIFFYSRGCYIS